MILDLSLKNTWLYEDCVIEEVGGRLNLTTPIPDAMRFLGRNLEKVIEATPAPERGEVTLTGAMAVWAYLCVFHSVLHRFGRVYYDDGRSGRVLIAAHG